MPSHREREKLETKNTEENIWNMNKTSENKCKLLKVKSSASTRHPKTDRHYKKMLCTRIQIDE